MHVHSYMLSVDLGLELIRSKHHYDVACFSSVVNVHYLKTKVLSLLFVL